MVVIAMKFVSRAELGWGPSPAAPQAKTKGVKLHYEGGPVTSESHASCARRWQKIRAVHLNHPTENYSDVAYNFAVCQHGYVFEGRGYGKRTGANGTLALNQAHYAVLWMGGTSGVTTPSPEAVAAIQEVIQNLRKRGAGMEIKGHRDGFATACPGDALYSLVKSGALEPAAVAAVPSPAPAAPALAPFPGAGFFRLGRISPLITAMGKALVAAGYKGYLVGPSPVWGPGDKKAVKWFQEKQGWVGDNADGIPGEETWKRLKVKKP